MKSVTIRYGVGYGEHITGLDFDDDATEAEMEADIQECINERLWWSYEVNEEDAA